MKLSNDTAIKTIGICAPSGRMNNDTFAAGKAVLESAGYTVFVHPQCHAQFGQMAGPAQQRAAALLDVLTDPTIDAVWLMAGGHRGLEILPLLDWNVLHKITPKPVLGFSDGSVIVNAINARLGWPTYFAPTVQTLGRLPDLWPMAHSALMGTPCPVPCVYDGAPVQGKIIASTLSLLPLLIDTPNLSNLDGAILCIEDIHEELSTIDRLCLYLKTHGVFDKIGALVCGSFTDLTDTGRPFGFTLEEIVRHHVGDIPIAFDGAFGHGDVFYPLPIGCMGRLDNNVLSFM